MAFYYYSASVILIGLIVFVIQMPETINTQTTTATPRDTCKAEGYFVSVTPGFYIRCVLDRQSNRYLLYKRKCQIVNCNQYMYDEAMKKCIPGPPPTTQAPTTEPAMPTTINPNATTPTPGSTTPPCIPL